MDDDLRALRRYLKEINTTGLRQLCHEAGFTDEETDIFAMCYSEGKSEQYIADKYYLGIDALHNTKMRLLSRLQHFCRTTLYRHEFTPRDERLRIIDDFLRKI